MEDEKWRLKRQLMGLEMKRTKEHAVNMMMKEDEGKEKRNGIKRRRKRKKKKEEDEESVKGTAETLKGDERAAKR